MMADTKQAYDLASYGWYMHIVAVILWIILGSWQISEYFRFEGYYLHPETAPPGMNPSDMMFVSMALAGLFIIFSVVAAILALLIRWRVLENLSRMEYELAARHILLLGGIGLIFGLGLGGALLLLSLVRLKDALRAVAPRAEPVEMVAEATPICPSCGSAARFIHGAQKWRCDHCARYL
ncbi:MAG: transposase [Thermoplasmatota archaeon]